MSFLKRHIDLHDGSEDFAWPPTYVGGAPPKEKKEETWVSPRKKATAIDEGPATRTRHKVPVETTRTSPRKAMPNKSDIEEKSVSPKKKALETAEQSSSKAKVEDKPTSSKSLSTKSAKMASRVSFLEKN